jgi:hypothetical protein
MLTGFRMTSVMRTSTLSSVTKHVGANTTIRARILVRSGVLASQSDEEFDRDVRWAVMEPTRPGRGPMALLWGFVSGIEVAEAGRQNSRW